MLTLVSLLLFGAALTEAGFPFYRFFKGGGGNAKCRGTRYYEFRFAGTWTSARQPLRYPGDAAFSPPVVVSHSDGIQLFAPGLLANAGVKDVAETGNPATLVGILESLKDSLVLDYAVGSGPIPPNGFDSMVSLLLKVNGDFPLVSFVTMVFPSPDWFTGLRNINMCDEYGNWKFNFETAGLNVYDAGTDSGEFFDSANLVTNPPQPISMLRCDGLNFCPGDGSFNIPSVGLSSLELTCGGQKTYDVVLTTKFDPAYSFGTGVVVSHSSGVFLFEKGSVLTLPPVIDYVETGAIGDLAALAAAITPKLVLGVATTDPIGAVGQAQTSIDVDSTKPLITFLLKINEAPDGFAGVNSFNVCNQFTGKYRSYVEICLSALSGGTRDENGNSVNPQNPVSNTESGPIGSLVLKLPGSRAPKRSKCFKRKYGGYGKKGSKGSDDR